MQREFKKSIGNDDIDTTLSDERLKGLAGSEMADRGPKAIDTTKNDWPSADGKATLMGVSSPGNDNRGDDDDDDDDVDLDDAELDVAAPDVAEIDTTEIDDTDIDDDDLDITLDDDEEEDEDDI